MAIESFDDPVTQEFFETGALPRCGWASISRIAARKLDMMEAATSLMDLRSAPGNMLKRLSGELSPFYSIRINDQWRIMFTWGTSGPAHVRIIDYH